MKYIFCDLDGTLLHDFYRVDDKDIAALKRAYKQGYLISIATGRLDYEINGFMEKYGIHGYRISQNGGIVFNDRNEIVYESLLKTEEVRMILDAIKGLPVLVFIQTENEYLVPKRIQMIEDFEKNQPFARYIEKPDVFEVLDELRIVTVSLWTEKDQNIEIKRVLDHCLPESIMTYVSSEYTIDITNALNSKGNAIKQLAKSNSIEMNDVYTIGDSFNDISMFEITPHSFVMKKAKPQVKEKATHVVSSVADAIDLILSE